MLKARKRKFFFPLPGFSNTAHNAGLSVRELMPESPTAIAIVRENWLYNCPVMPGMNETGTKTAISTKVVAMIGPRTSASASLVTCCMSLPPSSSRRITFSTTTIASSTTKATASTMPSRLKVLIEKPKINMKANVPIKATGTAIVGINVARTF